MGRRQTMPTDTDRRDVAPDTTTDTTKTPDVTTKCDREALLALADELEGEGLDGWASGPLNVGEYARRIREALGVES